MMQVLSFSFLAGLLTSLSPCVFPIIPLIVGSSFQKNKLGPIAIALGMVCSFTVAGVILLSIDLPTKSIRPVASILLIIAGLFILSHKLQDILAKILTPLASKTDKLIQKTNNYGLLGQFLTGALLGILWSPCTGPTMGATLALGAQNGISAHVILSMLFFGIGASIPILALAYGTRSILEANNSSIISIASKGKIIFGYCIILVGLVTLFGFDKSIEKKVLDISPEWLTELSVKY